MATAAERKRAQRQRVKESGGVFVQITLPASDLDKLRLLHRVAADGDDFGVWMAGCLMTGAAFKANSGGRLRKGQKVTL